MASAVASSETAVTATDLAGYLGRRGLLAVKATDSRQKSMAVPVKVINVKKTFGNLNLLIEPIGGRGAQWVNSNRLTWYPMKRGKR